MTLNTVARDYTYQKDLSAELNAQSEVILNTDILVSNADQLLDETGKITASLFALRNRILLSRKIGKRVFENTRDK